MMVKINKIFVYLTNLNKMTLSIILNKSNLGFSKLSQQHVELILKFLKDRAKSMYFNNQQYMKYVLDTLDGFFSFRMNFFMSTDAFSVMQSIAKYFCFISDTADFALCKWNELVLMVAFIVPQIDILDEKLLYFRFNDILIQIREAYYVYPNGSKELTFGLTIIQ
jgi:hypothetical protein